MVDYKLSELNSIDTIRSDDLLHVRVKKRPEMLGDEDRRMTYQDFLASFKLERFVQIAGSTMTGDLGIVKLLYGGKSVFDPTGSSEITIGDVLKTFKINANGLKLTIADASRSATVYHTLNKPSPNELGMRTNEENDARYARLAVTNTFSGTQNIQGDVNLLRLRNQNANNAQYIEGVNLDGSARWLVGISKNGSDAVQLYNNKYDSALTIASNVSVNKSLAITGQVQPSDFSNLDARYFTQTAANQRFAQLAGNNTFSGSNTFINRLSVFKKDGEAIRLQNNNATRPLYIMAIDSEGAKRWYVGNTDTSDNVVLENYKTGGKITVGTSVNINKTLTVTGQVQPSDWTNIDSRYIPVGTLSNLAKLNVKNTFSQGQIINADGEGLKIQGVKDTGGLFLQGCTSSGAKKWFMGTNDAGNFTIREMVLGTELSLRENYIQFNKNVTINGQVQPSDFSNLDARYYVKSATDAKYIWSAVRETVREEDGGVAWNKPSGIYLWMRKGGGSNRLVSHMFVNTGASTPAAQLMFDYRNGGMWYRTARDAHGFEQDWAKVYTEAQKPTPSEIGAYTKAETDQKIATAITNSTDLNKIYPVGIVTWFNSNVDPNTALPGLTWTYLNNGVGRTIRIAAANGSDVATTGGSDSVTLSVGNLPSHTHSFSATTSSFDYGTKTTNSTGAHTHSVSGSTNNTGAHTHTVGGRYGGDSIGGKQRVQVSGTNQVSSSAGAHAHTVSGTAASAGAHAHTVGIGAHSHTVSGNTGGTGSGSAFSVTNQFYKLMAWVRTA
ncbi:tail fiber protein [Salmonella phage vB_SPuM_SP116]|uniref:Putative tail fiber protein n=1 Tax=Salmonella phage vB_SPuM_SP116 TaxID=1567025 RepID=A0A0D4DAL8_9CAUD|nr:tail fiber protein [Salmonella phage vB_SPuM_SP116]AJT60653.1 putative tail fiber protein [Salmonella phage vB_SPuM_SP116]